MFIYFCSVRNKIKLKQEERFRLDISIEKEYLFLIIFIPEIIGYVSIIKNALFDLTYK